MEQTGFCNIVDVEKRFKIHQKIARSPKVKLLKACSSKMSWDLKATSIGSQNNCSLSLWIRWDLVSHPAWLTIVPYGQLRKHALLFVIRKGGCFNVFFLLCCCKSMFCSNPRASIWHIFVKSWRDIYLPA